MTILSDTQAILLSSASQRESHSVYPLPACLRPGGGVAKAIDALVAKGLAEERETEHADAVRRIDGDLRYGVYATADGLAAIGAVDGDAGGASCPSAAAGAAVSPDIAEPTGSKAAQMVTLLQRTGGATSAELIAATGWLPHTVRAALTGIRKKGHVVERTKRGDATCYRIVAAG